MRPGNATLPTERPSISETGVIPPKVPVTKASSALYTSTKEKSFRRAESCLLAYGENFPRVTPFMQYFPVEVQTSPLRTMKKLVALQVDTNPLMSNMRASSAPAPIAWLRATTSCSLLWQFKRGSK